MRKVEVSSGIELGERTYLNGVYLEGDCPDCNEHTTRDFGDDGLSYPVVGEFEQVYLCCAWCDRVLSENMIKVDLIVTIADKGEM